MKKILIVLGVIGALILVLIVAGPALVPAEKIKAQVAEQVKSATGRDLSIDGKVAASFFPSLSVVVSNVGLSNPPGFRGKELARLGALQVSLKIIPLLSGRVEIDSFKMVEPVIALEVNAQGRNNWTFASREAPAAAEAKPAGDRVTPSDLHLGDVGIQNGKLTYSDARSGAAQEFDAIDMKVSLESLDNPLTVAGGLRWRNQPVTLKIQLDKPRAIVEGTGATQITASVSADPMKLGLTGQVKGADKSVAGDAEVNVPSVRGLAAWVTGKALDLPGTGLGPFAVKGKLAMAGNNLSFSQAAITLDAIKATGDLSLNTGGSRPAMKGRLDIETLDLNPYLPPEAPAKSTGADWSDDVIDASGLKAAEIDFTLKTGGVKIRKIQIGKSALDIDLHGGQLSVALTQMELYGGAGTGRLNLDGAQSSVGVEAAFSLKGLSADALLTDAVDFQRLSGTASTEIQVAGRGRNQREIISALSGKGSVAFLDGAIKGIDIPGMVRNVTSAFTADRTAQKTDFAELSGSYTIAGGILTNQDLTLQAPLLRVGGGGTVDLPKRSMKYRIEPKVAATLQGQGGAQNAAGITIPVLIEGPWDKLSYRPDLAGAAKGAAGQAVQGILGGKAPSLKGLLPGLGLPK